ncbi:beta-1,3-glucosyltransferase-like [Lineus longissimus]|uniref:beta-1,3-glucosyltransferase-like n=1 Tax=Lineus longissimus TaxID=88925 RepID=UPI002B4EE99C
MGGHEFPDLIFSLLFSSVLLGSLLATVDKIDMKDVSVVILSQPNSYHAKKAQQLKDILLQQAKELEDAKDNLNVILLHEKWQISGAWTVLPIIPSLAKQMSKSSWVFFCEDGTQIDLKKLLKVLNKYDAKKKHFLAKGLIDQDNTIIHHFFRQDGFLYPDFAAGFALSKPLMKDLGRRIEERETKYDFSIDTKHEIAKFIWDEGKGVAVTNVREFCTEKNEGDCATTYREKIPNCGPAADLTSTFFAVKTCEKFHKDRVPVVKSTWAKDVKHIEYYSDLKDSSIPTIDLGVENTERGHCGKTHAILKRAFNHPEISKKDWLVIADDDTLFSIPRLQKVLACYNPTEPVALGERYGYGTSVGRGYDYITGGGGMVFSRAAVKLLMGSGGFRCPSNDSPDDMLLGMALQELGIPATHSPLFHQARPDDYSTGYLSHQKPVSFHKHWNCDPYKVYEEFLKESPLKRDEL